LDTYPALLAVLTVDEDDRIRCQSPGCNHPVFKRVHVLRFGTEIRLLGSSCFRNAYLGKEEGKQTPRYTSKAGRKLTEDERALLVANTAELVRRIESGWLLQQLEATPPRNRPRRKRGSMARDPLANVPAHVVAEARRRVSIELGVDASLPGWYGLVVEAVKAILRQNVA
jgi:hypothetical protein